MSRKRKPIHLRPPEGVQAPRDAAPAERWQHGTDAALTPSGAQRSVRPVDTLRRYNRIGDAEVAAATRFYDDWAFSVGARDPEKSGSGGGVDGYNISQIDAITRLNAARAAFGPGDALLLHAVVIDERSMDTLAGGSASVRDRVTKAVAALLKKLSDHYAEVDSRPKRVYRRVTKG